VCHVHIELVDLVRDSLVRVYVNCYRLIDIYRRVAVLALHVRVTTRLLH